MRYAACHNVMHALRNVDYVMSHDQRRASDWTRQDPVAEQLAVREFFSQRLKGVACETRMPYVI